MYWRILIFSILLVISSCRKDNIDSNNYLGTVLVYAPFNVGSELYYEVDSTIYNDFKDTIIHKKIFRRCLIDSLDNSIKDRIIFRVQISETMDTLLPWKHVRVDQWAITNQYFETQVQNIRFTHLIFPFNYESTWNVNQYNTSTEKLRYYTEIEEAFNINNYSYANSIQVENEPLLNSVVDIQYQEVFAKNIGCVYKKITNIETQFGKPRGYATTDILYAYKI